jgi:hypothetical protein
MPDISEKAAIAWAAFLFIGGFVLIALNSPLILVIVSGVSGWFVLLAFYIVVLPYIVTGILALSVYWKRKNRKEAMWVWTVLFFLWLPVLVFYQNEFLNIDI